jgi:four helix bundle protein
MLNGNFAEIRGVGGLERSRDMTSKIYECTKLGEFAKDFGLKDQIRRAAVSVMSNIAEGFDRGGNREFIQFLAMAKGSMAEVKSQLYVAVDQKYVPQKDIQSLLQETEEIGRMIGGLSKYLQRSPMRGNKFNQRPGDAT